MVGLRIAVKCDTNLSARRTQTLVPRECSKVKSKRGRRVPQFSLKNSGGGLRDKIPGLNIQSKETLSQRVKDKPSSKQFP